MAIGVRYEYDHGLKLDDGSEFWCDDLGVFGAPSSVMAAVSLTSLRHALGRHAQVWGPGDAELWVLGDSPDRFDEETSEPLPYRLVVRDGQLVVAVDVPESSLGLADEEIEAAIAPVIYRHGAESLGVWIAEWREATFRRVALHVPTARRTARTAFQLGQEVLQTLDLRVHGKPDHAWFVRILESGLWNLLCDLEETSWLEAKREHYRNDARGELDFASDVAALCNCEGGPDHRR